MTKQPTLERIDPGFGSSFTLRRFDKEHCNNNKSYWHFHPEYEIVYVSNGHGKRHIGNHISYYEDGDLIFLGPNLPHFSFTEELHEEHVEIVLQLREEFLGPDFMARPEMKVIRQVFERAKLGLSFQGRTKERVGEQLQAMFNQSPFERLVSLLNLLYEMGSSSDYRLLNADGPAVEVNAQDRERMENVYRFVQNNFQRPIALDEVAALISMTVPAFCRYFKKLTHKTFTQFVNEFRIAHACQLLQDESLTIAAVSFDSGFNNLSHFNKQFRAATGVSPREYRSGLRRVVA